MKHERIGENPGPLKLIFNYADVFFSFFYDDTAACIHRSREYAMNYVYSGEMVLDNGREQIHVGKGECVYTRATITSPSTRNLRTGKGIAAFS